MANCALPNATLSACGNSDTTIPESPFFQLADNNSTILQPNGMAGATVAACAISSSQPGGAVLAMICNTTFATANADPNLGQTKANTCIHNNFFPATIIGYEVDGCSWRYCNLTGTRDFQSCVTRQKAKDLQAKYFEPGNSRGTVVEAGQGALKGEGVALVNADEMPPIWTANNVVQTRSVQASGADRIQWRTDKKKKTTISAALLLALGVAGLVLG
ncbi:hypothetical protein BJ878DRAFT_546192 [Calycina marina]|uniref:Uncharacterized protein n=1 Tax=Calycina marina TaxID=1763456 RepID=A0A9P7YWF5_9HELO|nr:hypothetical protein BJ878DRAFT_546192 [Calycina marina]